MARASSSGATGPAVRDFYDDAKVKTTYYPEMERFVKQVTGAEKVFVFDHNTRMGGGDLKPGAERPVQAAHNDYTEKSGPQRVRDLLPADEAETWLKGRFAIINVWRPIRGPVETTPLAVCDARSLGPDDLVTTHLVYKDRIGQTLGVAHNPDHRWYYFPAMAREEALLIKSYDSATDGRARFTPHTAFDDPAAPAEGAVRESIEIRRTRLLRRVSARRTTPAAGPRATGEHDVRSNDGVLEPGRCRHAVCRPR